MARSKPITITESERQHPSITLIHNGKSITWCPRPNRLLPPHPLAPPFLAIVPDIKEQKKPKKLGIQKTIRKIMVALRIKGRQNGVQVHPAGEYSPDNQALLRGPLSGSPSPPAIEDLSRRNRFDTQAPKRDGPPRLTLDDGAFGRITPTFITRIARGNTSMPATNPLEGPTSQRGRRILSRSELAISTSPPSSLFDAKEEKKPKVIRRIPGMRSLTGQEGGNMDSVEGEEYVDIRSVGSTVSITLQGSYTDRSQLASPAAAKVAADCRERVKPPSRRLFKPSVERISEISSECSQSSHQFEAQIETEQEGDCKDEEPLRCLMEESLPELDSYKTTRSVKLSDTMKEGSIDEWEFSIPGSLSMASRSQVNALLRRCATTDTRTEAAQSFDDIDDFMVKPASLIHGENVEGTPPDPSASLIIEDDYLSPLSWNILDPSGSPPIPGSWPAMPAFYFSPDSPPASPSSPDSMSDSWQGLPMSSPIPIPSSTSRVRMRGGSGGSALGLLSAKKYKPNLENGKKLLDQKIGGFDSFVTLGWGRNMTYREFSVRMKKRAKLEKKLEKEKAEAEAKKAKEEAKKVEEGTGALEGVISKVKGMFSKKKDGGEAEDAAGAGEAGADAVAAGS